MKEFWLFKLGAVASILFSFSLFFSGIILIAFMPQAVSMGEFLRVFAKNPFWIQLSNSLLALGGFLGFLIVSASYFFFKKENEAWTPFLLALGIIWSFSQAFHGVWDALRLPFLSSGYLGGNEAVRAQAIIQASLGNPIDPKGFGTFFVFGLWVFLLGILTFRSKRIHRLVSYLSFLLALILWLLFFGQLFSIRIILAVVLPLFLLIVGPLFWFLFAQTLWQNKPLKSSRKVKKLED